MSKKTSRFGSKPAQLILVILSASLLFQLGAVQTFTARAQACDPASGGCDTPGPTCGLPGLPPCGGNPPPSTEVPTRRRPTRTPTPTATPTPTSSATATETGTPTATAIPCTTGFLNATMTGADEVSSVVTKGKGTVKLLLDTTAGTITGNWQIDNLSGPITASHIHTGSSGTNGPVLISLGPLPSAGGTFATLSNAPVKSMQDVLANPSAFYINVHTSMHPGGEIRGQLACAPAGQVASPTLSDSATPAGVPAGGGSTGGAEPTESNKSSPRPSPWLLGALGAIIVVALIGFGLWRGRSRLPTGLGNGSANPGPSQFQKADDQFQKADFQFQKADSQFQKADSQFQKADNQFQKADDQFQKADDKLK